MPLKAILATGDRLVGSGVRSFDGAIEELIRKCPIGDTDCRLQFRFLVSRGLGRD